MFKPKTYRRNDLEVYRLIDSGGEEVFYEGSVNYDSDRLFSDSQGKIYYQTIGILDTEKSYYVEVSPVTAPIPAEPEVKNEKDIVSLLVSSPRDSIELPADVFKTPVEEKPATEAPPVIEEAPIAPVTEEPAIPEQADEEEKVIHEPYIDQLLKENFETEAVEKEAPVEAVEEQPEPMPEKRKRRIPIPLIAAALIFVIFIAIAGVYVVKPDLFMGGGATPTASPTIVPTPLPSVSPTPTPTPTPTVTPSASVSVSPTPSPSQQPSGMTNEEMLKVSSLIATGDPGVKAKAEETVNPAALSTNNSVWIGCDLYDYLDDNWVMASSNPTPAAAPLLLGSLKGADMEYSALFCSLAGSVGVDTRVIIVLNGSKAYYYPEFKLASSTAGRDAAFAFIQNRYHCVTPAGHQSGNDFWISMMPGGHPGITMTGASEYSITPAGTITKLK